MLVPLGDLKGENGSFSFDKEGHLRLIFSDQSVIVDGGEGVFISAEGNAPRGSEAQKWMKAHCPLRA